MFRQNQMLNSIVEKGKKISSTKLSIFYFHNMVQKKTEILFLFTTVFLVPRAMLGTQKTLHKYLLLSKWMVKSEHGPFHKAIDTGGTQ